ncbi:phosphodiesterase 1B [Rhinolophus ferrumequinum]|uniref:Phosphodiesterase 1B n=1 Tax=Rhinolophus ferrumequinum TaxID=59479 RepID=A0A7J7WSG1_RHIFE|nr:phosphodiesterase 1B [Rhinolophus ferrumequinum]
MELSPRSPPEMLESDCPSALELKSAPSKKMWIKLRSLLRYMVKQLENGEVNIEELKKNLEYTASLLEAVYIDETRFSRSCKHLLSFLYDAPSGASGKSWTRKTSCRSSGQMLCLRRCGTGWPPPSPSRPGPKAAEPRRSRSSAASCTPCRLGSSWSGCSGERTPLWAPPIPLRSSTVSRTWTSGALMSFP